MTARPTRRPASRTQAPPSEPARPPSSAAPPPPDPGDPRIVEGLAWQRLCDALRRAAERVLADDAPASPRDRAEGFRYLLRFLAAGISNCVEHADPDDPSLGRMIDVSEKWGLDAPDCLYLTAPVRGDGVYRLRGPRGSAHHLDVQVNYGHFASGRIESWGTIASTSALELGLPPDGELDLWLAAERPAGAAAWLPLAPSAEFVLVRQYFADWDRERPADLVVERVDREGPAAPLRSDRLAERIERLVQWLDDGGALWDRMSRAMLALPPNTLRVHLPEPSGERAGLRGQAYGMGNFRCGPGEAVIVELDVPRCHHWSLSLADFWWESLDYASRQSSLNGHQAVLGADRRFVGVIAHDDPGVANWLDTSGVTAGTLAARFLLVEPGDRAPEPALRAVARADLDRALPPDLPRVTPEERAATLAGRRRAVARRFRA